MKISIGDLTRLEKDYIVTECITAPESFLGVTKITLKKKCDGLQGMSRMILNLHVRVKMITPEQNPEYYL